MVSMIFNRALDKPRLAPDKLVRRWLLQRVARK
jgi:hypothetical protein